MPYFGGAYLACFLITLMPPCFCRPQLEILLKVKQSGNAKVGWVPRACTYALAAWLGFTQRADPTRREADQNSKSVSASLK